MKKLLLLSLLILFSCSKEEEEVLGQNLIDRLDGKAYFYSGLDDSYIYIVDKSNKYIPITLGYKARLFGYECRRNHFFNKDLEGRFIRREVVVNNDSRFEVHNFIGSYVDSTVEIKHISVITASPDLNTIQYVYTAKQGDDTVDSLWRTMSINDNNPETETIWCRVYIDD